MFANTSSLFEVKENEVIFEEICQQLRDHSFQSPWALCFRTNKGNENCCEVQEIDVYISKDLKTEDKEKNSKDKLLSNNEILPLQDEIDEKKFLPLKTSLLSIQEGNVIEEIAFVDLLSTLTLPQVPQFCKFIEDSVLNETSIAVFLKSISDLKKPLSITITLALINQIIYPKIVCLKCSNYRNLSSSIIKILTVYPKAVLDGILIPCLKEHSLETSLQEILLKVIKNNLSDDHVAYCIQNIASEDIVTENTFTVLQILIEKKIPYNYNLQNALANKLESLALTYSSNMKFTKVLISILSIYGSELTEQQLKLYKNIVQMNQTIMRRAAENVFKKLKI